MLITSDFPKRGVYGLAFLDPRANGDQFVMNLEFDDKDFAKAAILLDQLLERASLRRPAGRREQALRASLGREPGSILGAGCGARTAGTSRSMCP